MKRSILLLLLAITLIVLPATAETTLTFGDDLTGAFVYPEGCAEADALYIYRYRYPTIAGNSDLADRINGTYAYSAEDALGFEAPMQSSAMQPGNPQKVVDISYDVTFLNDTYLSLQIIKRVTISGEETTVISGHVFALAGSGAGKIMNLPTMLGLLKPEETDEWLLTRQTNKADAVVRRLVWDKLQAANGSTFTLWEDMTFEEFEASFYPEEDFYLTEAGDYAFFMQAGTMAPEEQGLVVITLTAEEIDDEL